MGMDGEMADGWGWPMDGELVKEWGNGRWLGMAHGRGGPTDAQGPKREAGRDGGRRRTGLLLLLVGHSLELTVVGGVGEKVGKLVEVFVGGERPGSFEEAEFGCIRGKDVAEGPDLPGVEAPDLKFLARRGNAFVVLGEFQHPDPEPIYIEIRGEIVAV